MLNQPFFFPTTLRNTIMQTESGTMMLKQNVINYKTDLQADGPSPVRHEHLNALKLEARMRALVLLRKHIKKNMGGLLFSVRQHEFLTTTYKPFISVYIDLPFSAFFFFDWKDFNTHRAGMRHRCSSRAVSTSQSCPSPLNLSIIRPTPVEADRGERHSD